MEARCKGFFVACFGIVTIFATSLYGSTERSRNFVVTAATPEIAKQVIREAELFRYKLALEWLGKPLPNWKSPCTVNVKVGQIGAGGATTFVFDRGNVGDYKMNIQGSLERILDSVLPHEINHTIFAEHFRRPMPRWADEGAATFVEDESERRRQMLLAMDVLKTVRRIPLKNLLSIMDYPRDMRDVLNLYAEGYVLTELLIQCGGRAKFLNFLQSAHTEGWDRAIHSHYGRAGISALDQEWNQWVMAGCPAKATANDTMLASNDQAQASESQFTARSQAPDREPVSVVDAAQAAPRLVAESGPGGPRLGAGLQAPHPHRGAGGFSEPAMLNQVELGSEMEFVPPVIQVASTSSRTASSDPRDPTPHAQPARRSRGEERYASSEFVDAEMGSSPVDRLTDFATTSLPVRPVRASGLKSQRTSIAIPSLRLDSPTRLGPSRMILGDDL